MKVANADAWAEWQANNTDPYGSGVIRYAERWADLMEQRMTDGSALEDVAKQSSHDADTEGITGFMHGAAVSTLAQVWEHGDALRRWHNLHTQIRNEGERANEKGTVLNPALLNLGGTE